MNFRSFVGQLLPPGMMEIFFIIAAIVMVIYLLSGIRVVKEWERAPVFRFGRYIGLKGPGIIWILPGIDKIPSIISLPDNCPECGRTLDYASFPVTKTKIETKCPNGHIYGISYENQDGSISIERI